LPVSQDRRLALAIFKVPKPVSAICNSQSSSCGFLPPAPLLPSPPLQLWHPRRLTGAVTTESRFFSGLSCSSLQCALSTSRHLPFPFSSASSIQCLVPPKLDMNLVDRHAPLRSTSFVYLFSLRTVSLPFLSLCWSPVNTAPLSNSVAIPLKHTRTHSGLRFFASSFSPGFPPAPNPHTLPKRSAFSFCSIRPCLPPPSPRSFHFPVPIPTLRQPGGPPSPFNVPATFHRFFPRDF